MTCDSGRRSKSRDGTARSVGRQSGGEAASPALQDSSQVLLMRGESDKMRAIAFGTALSSLRDGAELRRLHPPGFNRISQGHRTYLDNPKLITTVTRKPPIPFGHRAWIGPKR